ncbi:MAG TPA: hypothetical protein VIR78_06240 [Malonomonas sp.]
MDLNIVHIVLWLIAGLASFSFSLGNARVWTSICVGFVLILLAEVIPAAIPFLPGLQLPQVQALGYITGTVAIMVITHGFQEYYMFSRTLEVEGQKLHVYLGVLAVLVASMLFVLINPTPTSETLRIINIVENSCWVFLSVINIDMIRKIYQAVKDTPISRGFIAFMFVFGFIFLWKGAALYVQVYGLDMVADQFPVRYKISLYVHEIGNLLTSISVGATFMILARLLR